MNRNGFGAKGAKSLASTSNGKRDVVDVGPDRIIRSVGGNDIVIWLDSTDPRLSSIAPGAGVPIWSDKSANQGDMAQTEVARRPTYLHNAINGRPVISADSVNFQDYTGSHAAWSDNCYVLMMAKQTGGTSAGAFFGQHYCGAYGCFF